MAAAEAAPAEATPAGAVEGAVPQASPTAFAKATPDEVAQGGPVLAEAIPAGAVEDAPVDVTLEVAEKGLVHAEEEPSLEATLAVVGVVVACISSYIYLTDHTQ